MSTYKPLVLINGDISQLPAGSSISGASVPPITSLPYYEPVVIMHDPNGIQIADDEPYLISCQGDIVVAQGF